jgi:enoyl-CoA hydratase/carnithine racemase
MADEITTATEDGVCWITLNRAEKRNALTTGMIGTLRAAVESAAAGGDTVRVICARVGGERLGAPREPAPRTARKR